MLSIPLPASLLSQHPDSSVSRLRQLSLLSCWLTESENANFSGLRPDIEKKEKRLLNNERLQPLMAYYHCLLPIAALLPGVLQCFMPVLLYAYYRSSVSLLLALHRHSAVLDAPIAYILSLISYRSLLPSASLSSQSFFHSRLEPHAWHRKARRAKAETNASKLKAGLSKHARTRKTAKRIKAANPAAKAGSRLERAALEASFQFTLSFSGEESWNQHNNQPPPSSSPAGNQEPA